MTTSELERLLGKPIPGTSVMLAVGETTYRRVSPTEWEAYPPYPTSEERPS